MIFNPILAGNGKVKKVVLKPSYVTLSYNAKTTGQTIITITYDPEKQKNTCFALPLLLGNVTDDLLVIAIFPSEVRATWECTYAGLISSCVFTKESVNTFKLTLTHSWTSIDVDNFVPIAIEM